MAVDTGTTPADMVMAGWKRGAKAVPHPSVRTSQEGEALILLSYVWKFSSQMGDYGRLLGDRGLWVLSRSPGVCPHPPRGLVGTNGSHQPCDDTVTLDHGAQCSCGCSREDEPEVALL